MTVKEIAILGAGHGGLAAAADLGIRGFGVRLHARRQETLDPIIRQGGIQVSGVQEGLVPVSSTSTDLAEVIDGADLIMLVVPSVAHEYYARLLAPILSRDVPIFLNPGHTCGGLHFVHCLRQAGYTSPVKTCEAVTLTYICRKNGPASVEVFSYVKNLKFAGFPGKHATELYDLLQPLFPEVELRSSVLETGMTNINAVFHSPGMLMNAGWIEATDGNFLFYREGITQAVGKIIEDVDRERLEITRALKIPSASFLENFYQAGLTTRQAMVSGDISRACYESEPNKSIVSPPSLNHRYIHEDVGYGLVPFAAFGDLAGVQTPTIDSIIHLCSRMMGVDYNRNGLTIEKMGLAQIPASDLDKFVHEGD
ncbi:MAG: NAD/NADP octopine/nopaline dehydrogenase family protein [Rhodospirillaceae bacterium]